jgi:hypothetical protein
MNVEPLFTVAMLLALVVGFARSARSLRRRDLAIGDSTFTERGFHRARADRWPRIREIGRQDVHLLCTIIKLLGGAASGARGCAA